MDLAEAVADRRGCRIGLEGLNIEIKGTGELRSIDFSFWERDGRLVVTLDDGNRQFADRLELRSKWPVTCCRPGSGGAGAMRR